MRRFDSTVDLLVRNRDFAALWGSVLASTLGDRVHWVALAALVYQLTGNLTQTGLVFMITALPDLLLGLFAGVLVDRWDRRRVMIWCDLLRIPTVILIPLAAYLHLWVVYLLVFLINTLSIVFRPAKTAIIPSIVKREELTPANSLISITENAGDVLGYPVAGLLIGFATVRYGAERGLMVAFAFDGLTFLISALLLLWVRARPVARVARGFGSIWAELREGVAYASRHPIVRAITLVMLLGPLTLGATTPLLVGYAWEVLGGGEWEYAMLGTGIGVGSVVGGLWLTAQRRFSSGTLLMAGLGVMGLGVMGVSAVGGLWSAVALIGVTGAGSMLVMVPSVTLVQHHTPQHLHGRVFSVRWTLIFAALIASSAAGGWAGQHLGVQRSLLICGGLLVASVVLVAISPTLRRMALVPAEFEPQI